MNAFLFLYSFAAFAQQVVDGLSSSWLLPKNPKVLVLGFGFLGQEIAAQLEKLSIDHITASRSSGAADHQVDLLSPTAEQTVQDIAVGCTAVISTVGSIGTAADLEINASTQHAARAASKAGVQRFVFIGNDPRVREFASTSAFLKDYATGKEQAEAAIRQHFPDSYTILQPNFIYGGDEFSLSPPRVPAPLGTAAESILGLYPFQALAKKLPGLWGVAAGAPVSRERVAAAAINAALGICQERELQSRTEIVLAASRRPKPQTVGAKQQDVKGLKQKLYDLGDCVADDHKLRQALDILEEIETNFDYNTACQKDDEEDLLNGRWEFCFDVESELRSPAVKDLLEGRSPIKPLLNVQDICLKIFEHDNQQKVNVYVSTKVLGFLDIDLVVKTTIEPEDNSNDGMFLERFEGIRLAGIPLPIPDDWKLGRPLEFSYLDETMLIARGNGGDPHYLRREADNCDVDMENCYI